MRTTLVTLIAAFLLISLSATNLPAQMGDEKKPAEAAKPANGPIDPKTADLWKGDNPTDDQLAKMSQEELKERLCMKEVENLRNLKFKKLVKSKAMSKEQFAKAYGAQDESQLPMGFYSYTDEILYVNISSDARKLAAIRMHESVHALQQQNWGIEQPKTTEHANLFRGVREGEATAVPWVKFEVMKQMMYNLRGRWQAKRDELEQYTDGSAADQEYKAFDYAGAARFIDAIVKKDGWDAVSKLYKEKPALSTSQLLHPEKYLDKDKYKAPVKLDFPDIAKEMGGDWKLAKKFGPDMAYDTLGELGMRQHYLTSPATGPEADKIAAGWDGDWLTNITDDNEGCDVWLTAWETKEDSVKWADAHTKYFEKTVLPTYTQKEDSKLEKVELPKEIKPILEKASKAKSDVRFYKYEGGYAYFEVAGNFAIFVETTKIESMAKILGIVEKSLNSKK